MRSASRCSSPGPGHADESERHVSKRFALVKLLVDPDQAGLYSG